MQGHFDDLHEGHGHHGEGRHGRHCGNHGEGRHFGKREKFLAMMLMGRGPFGRGFMGEGGGRGPGRGGFGGGDDGFGPRGRSLGQGHIRLLVLSLIEAEPRHGYDLIKQIEEMSGGAYAPSPGVIYPTLTLLEEAGYAATPPRATRSSMRSRRKARRISTRTVRMLHDVERLKALGEHMKERESATVAVATKARTCRAASMPPCSTSARPLPASSARMMRQPRRSCASCSRWRGAGGEGAGCTFHATEEGGLALSSVIPDLIRDPVRDVHRAKDSL